MHLFLAKALPGYCGQNVGESIPFGMKTSFCSSVMNKLMFSLKKLYGDFKMECLESISANITELESAYLELKAAGILDILIHK